MDVAASVVEYFPATNYPIIQARTITCGLNSVGKLFFMYSVVQQVARWVSQALDSQRSRTIAMTPVCLNHRHDLVQEIMVQSFCSNEHKFLLSIAGVLQ